MSVCVIHCVCLPPDQDTYTCWLLHALVHRPWLLRCLQARAQLHMHSRLFASVDAVREAQLQQDMFLGLFQARLSPCGLETTYQPSHIKWLRLRISVGPNLHIDCCLDNMCTALQLLPNMHQYSIPQLQHRVVKVRLSSPPDIPPRRPGHV
eukprot:scaffold9324_cov19-Tisochrysis_lutea.AAC.2